MSSRTVEREIVQMEFDARKFSQGVGGATKDLGSFKKQFDMSQQERSLQHLERTANGIQFEGMQQGIQQVSAGFSAMQVVAFTVINRITNAILDMGKKLASAIAIDPVKTGLEEYELQLNSVQTIMANTAKNGTTLEDVNTALDELNEYADLTIYNFGQMTNAIGRFTTAGIDLDTSVQAIKGLSNVAALSGANAEEAARGQYQLSQALSSGVIRLQDWMSIENANMGGQVFRDSLIETAKVHGINVDKMIEKNGSFRLSLQEQWLTSEIMLETLSKFTGELSDQDLLALGYNEEQIKVIQETAKLALDAATKIKTVTQLVDVVKEALQSGWSASWRLIFGDFEQAKELWGKVGDIIAIPIEQSANERNKQLEFWEKTGGRQKVVDAFILNLYSGLRVLQAMSDIVEAVFGSVKAGDLLVWSERFAELSERIAYITMHLQTFKKIMIAALTGVKNIAEGAFNVIKAAFDSIRDIFKPISQGQILDIANGFRDLTARFKEGTTHLDNFKKIVRGVAAAIDIVIRFVGAFLGPLGELISNVHKGSSGFWEWLGSIADSIVAWREMAIETGLFAEVAAKVVEWVNKLADRISLAVDQFLELDIVKDVIGWFNDLTREDFIAVWETFLDVLTAIVAPFYLAAEGARYLYEELLKYEWFQNLIQWFKDLTYLKVKEWFQDAGANIREFFDSVQNSEIFLKLLEYLNTFDGRRFTTFSEEAGEQFSFLANAAEKVKNTFNEIDFTGFNESMNELGAGVKQAIVDALDWLIENAGHIDYSLIFDAIKTGVFVGIGNSLRNIASGKFLDNIIGDGSAIGGIKDSIVETLGSFQGVLTSYQTNIKADTLQKIAIAIAIFAGAILLLTWVDSEKLGIVTVAIVSMLATLFGSTAIMSKIDVRKAAGAAVAIVGIAIALAIAAVALGMISDIDPKQITQSLEAMGLGLTGLVSSIVVLGKSNSSLKAVAALTGLAVALIILGVAINQFGAMKPDVLAQGVQGVAVTLGILIGTLFALNRVGDKGLIATSLAIGDMAIGLIVLAKAVENFGKMDPAVIEQGLFTVGVALGGFAAFSQLVKPEGMFKTATAITIMAAALLLLSVTIKTLGSMNQDELINGLLGMGAALLILVAAANLMTGSIGGAIAMIIMSVALIAIAGALKLLSTLSLAELGIALLAIAGVFIVLGLAALILTPLVPVLLALGAALLLIGIGAALLGVGVFLAATGLVALAASGAAVAGVIGLIGLAIAEVIPKIATALAEGLTNFVTMIAEKAPELKEAFKTIILNMVTGFTETIPAIVEAALTMVSEILSAIAEKLPEIIQSGYDILLAFLHGIEDNIAEIVTTGLGVLTEFINGLKEGIPDLVTSAFDLLLEWLTAIDNAVVEYTPLIVEKGLAIAGHLIEGMAQGITAGAGTIKQAVLDLARAALDALGLGFLMDSPSRATYYVGQMAVAGLFNALVDGQREVRSAMLALTDAAVDELNPFERAFAEAIENEWELSPVITPVVDLDNVSEGARLADSLFRDVIFGSDGQETGDASRRASQGITDESSGVTFIQTINSPKALDNATIYRQTRTLVASRSRRAFGQ